MSGSLQEYDGLGSRRVPVGDVDGAAVSVETPDTFSDEQIGVTAFAYDDEEGEVQLTFGTDVAIGVWLAPDDARTLAKRLATAASEAEAEIDDEK